MKDHIQIIQLTNSYVLDYYFLIVQKFKYFTYICYFLGSRMSINEQINFKVKISRNMR